MKKLIISMVLCSSVSMAQECGETVSKTEETQGSMEVITQVPSHLRGATITITKADGSKETVKAEEFMVVKRKHQRPVVGVTTETKTLLCEKKVVDKNVENIVSLEAVRGDAGLEKNVVSKSETEVKTKQGVGVGLMYQRNVYKDLYLGGKVDSNENVGLNIGLGF